MKKKTANTNNAIITIRVVFMLAPLSNKWFVGSATVKKYIHIIAPYNRKRALSGRRSSSISTLYTKE
jgi:hypothetical protein